MSSVNINLSPPSPFWRWRCLEAVEPKTPRTARRPRPGSHLAATGRVAPPLGHTSTPISQTASRCASTGQTESAVRSPTNTVTAPAGCARMRHRSGTHQTAARVSIGSHSCDRASVSDAPPPPPPPPPPQSLHPTGRYVRGEEPCRAQHHTPLMHDSPMPSRATLRSVALNRAPAIVVAMRSLFAVIKVRIRKLGNGWKQIIVITVNSTECQNPLRGFACGVVAGRLVTVRNSPLAMPRAWQ